MSEKKEHLKEILEKIAKELEIANKLKVYELVISTPSFKYDLLLKFFEKSTDLDEDIRTKLGA